jgi:tetratricopeptide (TPR) repeat protein
MSRSRKPPKPATSTQALGLLLVTAVLLGAGAVVLGDWYSSVPDNVQASYVGRQSCVKCHQTQAKLYEGSHHDQAMDLATADTVLGDFSGVELEHEGITSRMFKDGERFMIRTEGPDGKPHDFQIKYVLGVDPLQNYMVEMDRPADMPAEEISKTQVLRVSWDTRAKKWFYLPAPDVFEKLAPDDELHWCGITQRWNASCAECHSTNVMKNFDEQARQYHTTFSEIDVSCEACHGPGSVHVQLANSRSLFWDRKRGYGLNVTLKGDKNEPQVQTCAECHARRQTLADGYDPGDNYWDHYSTSLLRPLIYQADGQIEDEVFEHGSFLQSKMYHKNIKCTDCHDPHSGKRKHEGNKLCTSCHQHSPGKYDSPQHHHHQEGGKGASCVECHMPITNYMEVHGRRDHSLRVPRPDLSLELGTSNACTACHLDQEKLREEVREAKGTTNADHLKQYLHFVQAARGGDETVKKELTRLDQWCADATKKWYGQKRPAGELKPFAYALDAARKSDDRAPGLLADVIKSRQYPAIVRATALEAWGELGGEEMLKSSQKQLDDPHPLVRSSAAMNLALLPPNKKADLLAPLLTDPVFDVRRAAARALADSTDVLSGPDQNRLQRVLEARVEGLMASNDRAAAHLAVGDLQLQMRNIQGAEAAYRQAMQVEPQATGARGQLAQLIEAMVQDRQAPESTLEEVAELRKQELALLARDAERAPNLAVVQFRYGMALLQQEHVKEGLAALAKTVELEPNMPSFAIQYAIQLFQHEQRAAAVKQLEAVLEKHPEHAEARALLEEMQKSE